LSAAIPEKVCEKLPLSCGGDIGGDIAKTSEIHRPVDPLRGVVSALPSHLKLDVNTAEAERVR
jgi:hypothetical protein